MDKLNQDSAAKLGNVLFRYMRARHRFKEKVEQPLPAHELTALIRSGKARQMKGDAIPTHNHVARYCKSSTFFVDQKWATHALAGIGF